jgi:hypothetical protein
MRKINKIQPSVPTLPTRKRVAAYARVSIEKGRTLHSLYEGNILIFKLTDGTEVERVWEWHSTARIDCWTPERRAAWSEQLKKRDKGGRWSPEARKKASELMKARHAENPNWNNRRREE